MDTHYGCSQLRRNDESFELTGTNWLNYDMKAECPIQHNSKALISTFGVEYMNQNKSTREIVGNKNSMLFTLSNTNLQLRKSIPIIIHIYFSPSLFINIYCYIVYAYANPSSPSHSSISWLFSTYLFCSHFPSSSKYQPSTLFFDHCTRTTQLFSLVFDICDSETSIYV